jgi:hypothetical protein
LRNLITPTKRFENRSIAPPAGATRDRDHRRFADRRRNRDDTVTSAVGSERGGVAGMSGSISKP